MPNLCGFSWINEIDAAIVDRANAYGLPLDIAYTFVAAESSFFSYSSGDEIIGGDVIVGSDGHRGMVGGWFAFNGFPCNGVAWESYYNPGHYYASHGLNQLSTCNGQGSGMLWSQLINPWINCDVAFPPIASAFRACWSPSIGQETFIRCVMRNSGHPGNVPDGNPVFEAAFHNIWPKWQCFYAALVHQPPPPNPDPPPNPPPNPPPLPDPIPDPPNPDDDGGDENIIESLAPLAGWIFVAGAGYLLATKSQILKKIKIYKPTAPVKIVKTGK